MPQVAALKAELAAKAEETQALQRDINASLAASATESEATETRSALAPETETTASVPASADESTASAAESDSRRTVSAADAAGVTSDAELGALPVGPTDEEMRAAEKAAAEAEAEAEAARIAAAAQREGERTRDSRQGGFVGWLRDKLRPWS